jgi:hypothetical protein
LGDTLLGSFVGTRGGRRQHSGIDSANTIVSQGLASAWTQRASSLKSFLETGRALQLQG